MTKPSFKAAGHSANIDRYEDPEWGVVEVLVHDCKIEKGKMVKVRPVQFNVTALRRIAVGGYVEEANFKYVPATHPKNMHLPARTVTRIVRAKLGK